MITTRSLPKYDAKGVELKAGNIVHVEYATGINAGPQKMLVPSALRNEPGVLTRVLKVVKPADYLSDVVSDEDKDRINKFCVAVELHNPASGGFIDIIQKDFKHYFNDGVVRAFEIMFRVAKAEDWQKEYYHKIYSK
jgi:hypothetical protein